jgi:hypothetical protein
MTCHARESGHSVFAAAETQGARSSGNKAVEYWIARLRGR